MTWQLLVFSGICSLVAGQIVKNDRLPPGSSFGVAGENASYDYVIVGAGTAGLPLAYRLAADGRYSVAVIEAGSFYELDNGNRSTIPGYDFYSAGSDGLEGVNPLIDWEFLTTPQPGIDGRVLHYPRGRCLGGSSARNYMVYQRPTVGTMKLWADEVGDQSWTWKNVLPYYKRSATFTPPKVDGVRIANATPLYDTSVFGDGPLQVSYARYAAPASSWLNKAFTEAGDPIRAHGMQSGVLLGHEYLPSTIDPATQERSSSKTSYLDLALRTTGLTVYTRSLVKKIIFDGTKTATGVQVEAAGAPFTISANREVIVSAGAFQSPQLLMVSGVGPADTLKKFDIPVIHDLPGVGQNLQDHPLFGITFAVEIETASTYMNSPARFGAAIAEYNQNRTGFLTSAGADAISFQKLVNMDDLDISSEAKKSLSWVPKDWPDVMIWQFFTWLGPRLGSTPPSPKNYASFIGGVTTPLSRGSVTLASADMADKPIIDPRWLTHPTDQALVVAGLRRMRQILATPSLKTLAPDGEAYPGADVTSDEALLAVARGQFTTFNHAAATCRMGREGDLRAVVDSKARVFGVRGLRVVDLSAVPFLPPGQPQATVYMLGEKIADEILSGSGGGKAGGKSEDKDEL